MAPFETSCGLVRPRRMTALNGGQKSIESVHEPVTLGSLHFRQMAKLMIIFSLFIGSEPGTGQQHVPLVELPRTGLPSVPLPPPGRDKSPGGFFIFHNEYRQYTLQTRSRLDSVMSSAAAGHLVHP